MTAIICFNPNLGGAVFLADTRLSYHGTTGQIVTVRDVCQKLFVPNSWSIVGFAGDLCLGNDLAGAFFQRLENTKWAPNHWLNDDDTVRGLVLDTRALHSNLGQEHEGCPDHEAGLLVAYVGVVDFNNPDGVLDHREPATFTISVLSDGTIERSGIGITVIGEAQILNPTLTLDLLTKVANAGPPESQVLMGLTVAQILVDKYRIASVGGLFQAAHISTEGVRIVPYFYWANVTRRFGTYVAMRIENGDWVQEHRPSGRIVRIQRPFALLNDEPQWQIGRHEMFEPRVFLNNLSPGVIRQPVPLTLLYAVYDPDTPRPEIVASWGQDPLPQLTWAESRSLQK